MAPARSFPLAGSFDVPPTHWDGLLAADIFAPIGTPALAVFDGAATAYEVPDGGNVAEVTADDGTVAYYAHLEGFGRITGRVTAGQTIGYVGTSGNAAGKPSHLHFAVGTINSQGAGTINVAEWLAGAVAGVGSPPGAPVGLIFAGVGILAAYLVLA